MATKHDKATTFKLCLMFSMFPDVGKTRCNGGGNSGNMIIGPCRMFECSNTCNLAKLCDAEMAFFKTSFVITSSFFWSCQQVTPLSTNWSMFAYALNAHRCSL